MPTSSSIGGTLSANSWLINAPLSYSLSEPLLEQAVTDCVFLFYKYWQGFSTTEHASISKRMEIISNEYNSMLQWLKSSQFSDICHIRGFDEFSTRTNMLEILHNPTRAADTARILKIRIGAIQEYLPDE